eukprot:TRINITY_DN2841_c0_g1_i1.p1 TRINITY_DN2841_c0_g1~~TRINITY_DN2841_c0_g1_i1.p1  ORF type:complete len:137 (+),score=21.49 TRINITY_DN2841_c0_g1_i1:77-487(+)
MIRRPPRSTQSRSSAASDVYKRQLTLSPRISSARFLKNSAPWPFGVFGATTWAYLTTTCADAALVMPRTAAIATLVARSFLVIGRINSLPISFVRFPSSAPIIGVVQVAVWRWGATLQLPGQFLSLIHISEPTRPY